LNPRLVNGSNRLLQITSESYGCTASEAWNETTRQCPAWRTYVFVKRQSSEISCPFIERVRCRRPVTTAALSYTRMRVSDVW